MEIGYKAEPTAADFHQSDAFFRCIIGPLGSGKSVACTMELLYRAINQQPNSEGIRKTRFAVIRNVYGELKSTTMKTVADWFPDSVYKVTMDSPIKGSLKFSLGDGTSVECEILFMALDQPKDTARLLSLELTGIWFNEVREIHPEIIDAATGRVGRFPAKKDGGPTWSGIFADTNPFDDDSTLYMWSEVDRPKGYEFYYQPPALLENDQGEYVPNPKAENVSNQPLGFDYWLRMVQGKSDDWIRIYVLGKFGTTQEGKPVFPEFLDDTHVSTKELYPIQNRDLILGWDYGLTPACVLIQITPRGQLRVLDEWVSEDMSVQQLARDVVAPELSRKYAGWTLESWGDPGGGRSETDGKTARQILRDEGIPTRAAPTNKIQARLESVRHFLTKMVDGQPGLLVDPKCDMVRKGLRGRYFYERVQVVGEARYKDQPSKNRYSHVMDALQYACLGLGRRRQEGNAPQFGPDSYKPASVAGY